MANLDELLNIPTFEGRHLTYPSGITISPDGKWAAWTWFNKGISADVYIMPTDGSSQPICVTNLGETTHAVSWLADGKSFIAAADTGGNERFSLYKVDIISKEIIPLTDEDTDIFVRGGAVSPDGKYLVYGTGDSVIRLDLDTRELRALSNLEKPAYIWPKLNRQGTHIIYERSDLDPSGEQIWLVGIDGADDREILNFGNDKKVKALWHPDGRQVLFIAEREGYNALGVYSIEAGETKWLLDDSKRNIENAWFAHGSESAVLEEVKDAVRRYSLIDPETLVETETGLGNRAISLVRRENGEWFGFISSSTDAGNFVLGGEKLIEIPRVDLVEAKHYQWKSSDRLEIQGWLYKTQKHPLGTIVLVHGGPTDRSEDTFNGEVQYFVSKGFNVLEPNYRGSTGFGLEFQEAIKKDGWGGMEQEDILAGIKSLIKDGIAEPYKIGITGTSYGGYSAWHAITHFPTEFVAAASPICGMTDLVVDYETTRPDLKGYTEEMMGGKPSEVPEKYFNASPINFVQDIKGKLLIVQGQNDPNVTPEHVRVVEEKLIEVSIKYEKLIFEDEGHGIMKKRNRKVLLERQAEFFKQAFDTTPRE